MNAEQKKDFKKAVDMLNDARAILGGLGEELNNQWEEFGNQEFASEAAFCSEAANSIDEVLDELGSV